MRTGPGSPFPLGATWDGSGGVNFALFSAHATSVTLCLFDSPDASSEHASVPLERTNFVWHTFLPDAKPGQLYGYRVAGPWNPSHGERFNPRKVVLDPYARALGREVRWNRSLFAYERDTNGDGPADLTDSAPFAPLATVVDGTFDWGRDRPPAVPWVDTVIYEAHVKGFSALHNAIPPDLRGTYLGLASAPAIAHMTQLGVTTIELLPIHAHAPEWWLAEAGRPNYWGYNTLSLFAADARFATSRTSLDASREFKTMVRALHEAGLEVLLDVVYNHTAEGDHLGPTLSLRGIDNATYYRLDANRPSRYENFTGCGNTLDFSKPEVVQLALDSLRYWADTMHVDGFRFDLTTTLGREDPMFSAHAAFLAGIARDPVLSRMKLIAEPWDLGPSGYQVGRFPAGWSEWNDQYRDDVRRFWRGERGRLPRLATRLAGSEDLFGTPGRTPRASINFITAHDGFTLADLTAYNEKHNEANGEDNRDGESNNLSWNCGVEGRTEDRRVLDLRERQRRNLLLTLFMSIGVPMLTAGDELGRSQSGNNNAYCQDSPITWLPWTGDASEHSLTGFVQTLAAIRQSHPALRQSSFLDASRVDWLRPDAGPVTAADWEDPTGQAIGMLLRSPAGSDNPNLNDELLILLNASDAAIPFVLPPSPQVGWTVLVNTARPEGPVESGMGGSLWILGSHSAAVLAPLPARMATPSLTT